MNLSLKRKEKKERKNKKRKDSGVVGANTIQNFLEPLSRVETLIQSLLSRLSGPVTLTQEFVFTVGSSRLPGNHQQVWLSQGFFKEYGKALLPVTVQEGPN